MIDELRRKVFEPSSDFVDKLANAWYTINAAFLAHNGKEDPESAFLNILVEQIHKNLPSCKVVTSVGLKAIPELPSEAKVDRILGMQRMDVMRKVCLPPNRKRACRLARRCFDGEYANGTEIDALVIRGQDICFLEFEKERNGLCDNFMKMYRLQQLLGRKLESLFVTKLTTVRQPDGRPTTFESFNSYVDGAKPILDALLQHWSVLEIVNLKGSTRRRKLHWRP